MFTDSQDTQAPTTHAAPALAPHLAPLRALGEGLQDGVIILGPAQDIVWANDAALRLHGAARLSALGAGMAEYLALFQVHFHRAAADETSGAPRAVLMDIRPAGAAPVTLRMTTITLRDDDGRPAAFTLVLRPEPAAQAANAAAAPDEGIARLFAALPAAALIVNPADGSVIAANPAFTALSLLPESELAGTQAERLFPCEHRDQRRRLETALQAGNTAVPLDARLRTARGDMIDVTGAALRITAFGAPCVLVALRDVTAQRRDEAQLFTALQAVMQDTTWFSRTVIEKLAAIRAPASSGRRSPALSELTPRERDVLGLISHGFNDAEIATRLGLTRSTVRNHVATLYGKIDVHSRGGAIVWARERGINLAHPAPPPAPAPRAAPDRPAARFAPLHRMQTAERAGLRGEIRG